MATTTTTDPVCGMSVAPSTAAGHSDWRGERYYFCSAACKATFDADPAKYGGESAGTAPAESGDGRAAAGLSRRAATDGSHHSRTTPDGAGERVDLSITGMSCAACARRIEQALGGTPGVRRAVVNFATSKATVEYDPKATTVRGLMGTVTSAGYDTAGTARAEFVVDDSARPSGSAQPLQDHLNGLRGVVDASFNLGTMQVRVD